MATLRPNFAARNFRQKLHRDSGKEKARPPAKVAMLRAREQPKLQQRHQHARADDRPRAPTIGRPVLLQRRAAISSTMDEAEASPRSMPTTTTSTSPSGRDRKRAARQCVADPPRPRLTARRSLQARSFARADSPDASAAAHCHALDMHSSTITFRVRDQIWLAAPAHDLRSTSVARPAARMRSSQLYFKRILSAGGAHLLTEAATPRGDASLHGSSPHPHSVASSSSSRQRPSLARPSPRCNLQPAFGYSESESEDAPAASSRSSSAESSSEDSPAR